MSNPSKYNFPNAQKVQIFEQVDQYIEHNHAAEPEVKSSIARPQIARPVRPLTLFFSYAHKDEALRDQLARHLALLKKQGILTTWHDRDISAGTEWAEAIATHLHTADLILLLISANFIHSNYCYDTEMQQALQRHDRGSSPRHPHPAQTLRLGNFPLRQTPSPPDRPRRRRKTHYPMGRPRRSLHQNCPRHPPSRRRPDSTLKPPQFC